MEENFEKDQAQKESPADTPKEPTNPKVIKKDRAPEEQSVKSEEVVEKPKLFKTPDGRELTADQIYEEYNKLGPEFTRRSQELAEYRRREAETRERNEAVAEKSVSQSSLLEGLDPTVKQAIIEIAKQPIMEALEQRDRELEQRKQQEEFDRRLTELEKKYPGGDGLPKFNKLEVLAKMKEPGNEIYDPEALYQKIHWEAYIDAQIKNAMRGKSGSNQTEATATEAPRRPGEMRAPRDWAEASRNALNRAS